MRTWIAATAACVLTVGLPAAGVPRQDTLEAQTPDAQASAARAAMRARFLELAELYCTFEWTAGEANVLHGPAPSGTPVDTPDVSFDPDGWHPDGSTNRGMPYSWGGFSSVEEFLQGLEEGKAAGNVPASSQVPGTSFAVGLDCSGFVARAWDLPTKQSTRTLGALCYELESYDELLPGDILNIVNGHVVLFKEWVDEEHTRMRVVEAARLRVEENEYPRAERENSGFVPMRYKPLDDRWVPMDRLETRFVRQGSDGGRWIPDPVSSYPELDELADPLRDAVPLEWASYEVTDDFGPLGGPHGERRMLASCSAERLATQTAYDYDGKLLMKGSDMARGLSIVESLVEFMAFEEPLTHVVLVSGTAEKGSYELDGRRFPAHRVSALVETDWSMHGVTRLVTVEMDCVLADEVPLQGVLAADLQQEVVWGENEQGETVVSRRHLTFDLTGFGGPDAKR